LLQTHTVISRVSKYFLPNSIFMPPNTIYVVSLCYY
jgi:hypothetical protein